MEVGKNKMFRRRHARPQPHTRIDLYKVGLAKLEGSRVRNVSNIEPAVLLSAFVGKKAFAIAGCLYDLPTYAKKSAQPGWFHR